MSLTINREFLDERTYQLSQEIVKGSFANKTLENLNRTNVDTCNVLCARYNKLYPQHLKILKALKDFNRIPHQSLTISHFSPVIVTVGKLEDLLLKVYKVALLTQHFLHLATCFQMKQITFHVIEKKFYRLRDVQFPSNILTYRKEVVDFEKIVLKQDRFIRILSFKLNKVTNNIHFHTQIFFSRLEYCIGLQFPSNSPRHLTSSASHSSTDLSTLSNSSSSSSSSSCSDVISNSSSSSSSSSCLGVISSSSSFSSSSSNTAPWPVSLDASYSSSSSFSSAFSSNSTKEEDTALLQLITFQALSNLSLHQTYQDRLPRSFLKQALGHQSLTILFLANALYQKLPTEVSANNSPVVKYEDISILLLKNHSGRTAHPTLEFERVEEALKSYKSKSFTYPLLNYLHKCDCALMKCISALFKRYHVAIHEAETVLSTFVLNLRDKNVLFETSQLNYQKSHAASLSDHYVKSFWRYTLYGLEIATSVQFFLHRVRNFEPKRLPLPAFHGSFYHSAQGHEKMHIFKKDMVAYQKARTEKYKFLLKLHDKIALKRTAFETDWQEAVDQLGRYEQTVANNKQPWNPIWHAFSRYHIRIIDEDEKKISHEKKDGRES